MTEGVLCAGRVYGDLLFTGMPRLPALGTEVFTEALSLHAGGGAYITAAWLSALGRPAELCATLPREPFASLVREEATANDVGLSATRAATAGDPQLTVVHVVDGDRAFTTRRAGRALPPGHMDALRSPAIRHLHISELTTLLDYPVLAKAARAAGLTLSLDCGWDDVALERDDLTDVLADVLADVDVFLPNEMEADKLGIERLDSLSATLVVVKRGSRGARATGPDGSCSRPAHAVSPLDTTGAGDAFDAGFVHAWLDARPVDQCLALGNACGALAVTRRGGAGHLPTREALARMLGERLTEAASTVLATRVTSRRDRPVTAFETAPEPRLAKSHMRREIEEIPDAAARLLDEDVQRDLKDAAARLRELDPALVATVARGSSDHAATCLAHAIGVTLGRPVASLTPALASVHDVALKTGSSVGIAISQSGRSSDIVALVEALERAGTPVLALTNTVGSPLGRGAGAALDIQAGPERAVAATKSVVSSILTGLWLVAHWSGSDALRTALAATPVRLSAALARPLDSASTLLADTDRLVVLGRGPALGLAGEIALKAIETCGIHASAYSAAEVLHGPATMLVDDFPVLVMNATHGRGLDEALTRLPTRGARLVAADDRAHGRLPDVPASHPLVHALDELIGLYAVLEAEARRRGRDPDAPANLEKETDTL